MIGNRKFIDEDSLLEGDVSATIEAEDLSSIFTLVTENFYSDIYGSIIRELVSNALDANVEAGSPSKIIVKYYEEENQSFLSIKDFGVGMGPEEYKTYLSFFKSTKKNSNDYIGFYGLGSKSPLGYTDSFTIITIKDGIKYHYILSKSVSGIPTSNLLYQEETNDSSGTEIIIALHDRSDKYKFEEGIKTQLAYFDNVYFEGWSNDIRNEFIILEGKTFKYRPYSYANRLQTVHICFGRVYYPIDWAAIKMIPIEMPLAIKFNIGELKVYLNRENVIFDEETITLVKERIEALRVELQEKYDKEYENKLSNFISNCFEEDDTKYLLLGSNYISLPYIYNHSASDKKEYTFIKPQDNKFKLPNTGIDITPSINILKHVLTCYYPDGSIADINRLQKNAVFFRIKPDFEFTKKEVKYLKWKEGTLDKPLFLIKYKGLHQKILILKFFGYLGLDSMISKEEEKRRFRPSYTYSSHPKRTFFEGSINKLSIYKDIRSVIKKEIKDISTLYVENNFDAAYLNELELERLKKRTLIPKGSFQAYNLYTSQLERIEPEKFEIPPKTFIIYDVKPRKVSEGLRDIVTYMTRTMKISVRSYVIPKSGVPFFKSLNHCISMEEFVTTPNIHIKRFVESYIKHKLLKELQVFKTFHYKYLEEVNSEIYKIISECKRDSYNLQDISEGLAQEIAEIAISNNWITSDVFDKVKKVQEFHEDIALISFVNNAPLDLIVDFLKLKKKKLNLIHYQSPSPEEEEVSEEGIENIEEEIEV